jgi:hypothetical protein
MKRDRDGAAKQQADSLALHANDGGHKDVDSDGTESEEGSSDEGEDEIDEIFALLKEAPIAPPSPPPVVASKPVIGTSSEPVDSGQKQKTVDGNVIPKLKQRKSAAGVSQESEEHETMCCVCLESKPRRFALLDCDHVLCTDDAKAWQKQKQADGADKNCGVQCPMCRAVTPFFWTSNRYAKGDDRKKLIENIKTRLALLPCCYGTARRCKVRGREYCPYLHTKYHPPPPANPAQWAWSSGWDHKVANPVHNFQ